MAYVLIQDGVVIQKQPNAQDGFIEVDEAVHCGQLFDGSVFTNPPPVPPTVQEQIATLEASVTPRRIREAAIDNTWMVALDAEIATLRSQL